MSEYRVNLDVFAGPLDLLLYLGGKRRLIFMIFRLRGLRRSMWSISSCCTGWY
jgi:hypothetical protein